MSEIIKISVDTVAQELGVPAIETEIAPGLVRNMIQWTPADGPRIYEKVKEKADGGPMGLDGAGAHWVLACFAAAMYPNFAQYSNPTITVPMENLPMGPEDPAGGIKFDVTTKDGDIYVEFSSDDPTRPKTNGPHNYDISMLPNVKVPPCQKTSHVYYKCGGLFPVLLNVLAPYFGNCASLNVAPGIGGGDYYVCVGCWDSSREVGTVTPF